MSLQEDDYALSEQRRRGYNAAQQRRFRARRKKELDEMQELNNKLMNELKELKANLETRVDHLEREQMDQMNEINELKESLEPRVEKLEREIDLESDINTEPESEPQSQPEFKPANRIASGSKDEGDTRQNRISYPIGAIRAAISGWDNKTPHSNNRHKVLARGGLNRIWSRGQRES
ncbi:hypothetical protein EDB81DRAFT_794070 [Dactylonectria macrodidyma]|uniref:BZIP domain-containing protein n=1 Tax=Dactylonectria macrodidyma TaxID=307937 RepID=A0A9P9ES50_9HYPO|nr:hypothetical protein EDB81DRAFT_794070 [Dactylonectria macrodidyma]